MNILPDFTAWWNAKRTSAKSTATLCDPGVAKMKEVLRSKEVESKVLGDLHAIFERKKWQWLVVEEVAAELAGAFLEVRLIEGFVRHYLEYPYEMPGQGFENRFFEGRFEARLVDKEEADDDPDEVEEIGDGNNPGTLEG